MQIRAEQKGDEQAIADTIARAFVDVENSDQTEPAVVKRLRAAGVLTLSLVAVKGAAIVGHAAISPVTVDGEHRGWFGLGPVSVLPSAQLSGIGSSLIRAGVDQLRSRGAAGCVVLGDPAYYRRFGFEQDGRLRYEGAPPEYFTRLVLGSSDVPSGCVDYASAFSG